MDEQTISEKKSGCPSGMCFYTRTRHARQTLMSPIGHGMGPGHGVICLAVLLVSLFSARQAWCHEDPAVVVVQPRNASWREVLAARELQRYLYLRTGNVAPILNHVPEEGHAIAVETVPDELGDQEYRLITKTENGRQIVHVLGGDDTGTLYGAYHFVEKLGVRFYLHGDVVPDEKITWSIPDLDERHRPLFQTRGIQPFHDFTEGPDWWEADDYKAYFSQLAKLRMNFLGLHCYPEGGVGPEPLVWIGLPEDIHEDGTVRHSYPSRWASTGGGAWGYRKTKTGDFAAGAGLIFEEDDFGPRVTRGHRPKPATPAAWNEVFDRAAAMLRDAFSHGRSLGIGICVGTETPLTIPETLRQRLRELEIDPDDPATVERLYEGMFRRIAAAYPIDFYWLWTPEGWTWSGTKPEQVEATVRDIRLALQALEKTGWPFDFATSGWVLGPPGDRALFDRVLPKRVALSCINRNVGFDWVEPGFAAIEGRPQWAIPWLEDDPAMIIPQLWVGRLRRDAADAHAYGCSGLVGIHWRTKVLAPNMAALAAAAWDQTVWNKDFGKEPAIPEPKTTDVHVGGQTAQFPNQPIADTEEDAVYQTCRYNLNGYRLKVPNGTYRVLLKFCEPHYGEVGKRVFGVNIQGRQVIDRLDVFEKVGKNKALDFSFHPIHVRDGELTIEFTRHVEYPFLAGIVVDGQTADNNQIQGTSTTRKINCGGPEYMDYESDLPAAGVVSRPAGQLRDLPADDFYVDWAGHHFGSEIAEPMAELFDRLDGGPGDYAGNKDAAYLPRPADWIGGPGGIRSNPNPWAQEKDRYAFVDEMAAWRDRVRGAGNRRRFDYWLNTFRYLRAVGQIGCTRGELDRAIQQIDAEQDPAKKRQLAEESALPVRIELARLWEQLMTWQLAVTDTPGEMGTLANLEMHVRRNENAAPFLDLHDSKLEGILGKPLPDAIRPATRYLGESRLIVPTRRSRMTDGESLQIKVIVLDNELPKYAALFWRPIGHGNWHEIPLVHVARGVHAVTLPPAQGTAIEYYIRTVTTTDQTLVWPATAPDLNQTVVIMPPAP